MNLLTPFVCNSHLWGSVGMNAVSPLEMGITGGGGVSPKSPRSRDIAVIGNTKSAATTPIWMSGSEMVWQWHSLIIRHRKVPHPYSQALPIHAKPGREWEPESACSFTGVRGDELTKLSNCTTIQSRSFLTPDASRAIVAGNAGLHEQRRHGYVFDNHKHMHSHMQATIGRAGSVTRSAIISS